MIRTERMKLLIQAIGADIKAILAKTNLLKTAAYKDVGTTTGKIPEFIGNDGMGGFGFGGRAKDLGVDVNLDTLPKVNAIYGVTKNNVVAGLPADMQTYVYNSEMTLQVLVSPNSYHITQVLTAIVYKPPNTSSKNVAVFTRCGSYNTWIPWERLSGQLLGVDVGEEAYGDDVEFNSIKVGLTSHKIAYDVVRVPITMANAKFNPDGTVPEGEYYPGLLLISSTKTKNRIIDIVINVYLTGTNAYNGERVLPEESYSQKYYEVSINSTGAIVLLWSQAYAQSKGVENKSSQKLFDEEAYVEAFVTYRVD